jgi:hypothetical protein
MKPPCLSAGKCMWHAPIYVSAPSFLEAALYTTVVPKAEHARLKRRPRCTWRGKVGTKTAGNVTTWAIGILPRDVSRNSRAGLDCRCRIAMSDMCLEW